jgi:hypothetical protein
MKATSRRDMLHVLGMHRVLSLPKLEVPCPPPAYWVVVCLDPLRQVHNVLH